MADFVSTKNRLVGDCCLPLTVLLFSLTSQLCDTIQRVQSANVLVNRVCGLGILRQRVCWQSALQLLLSLLLLAWAALRFASVGFVLTGAGQAASPPKKICDKNFEIQNEKGRPKRSWPGDAVFAVIDEEFGVYPLSSMGWESTLRPYAKRTRPHC